MNLSTLNKLFAFAVVAALFSSCASVKPCGEAYTETQEFFQSKKFKEAFHERDSLCQRTSELEGVLEATEKDLDATKADLDQARVQAENLTKDLNTANKKYDDLIKSSGAQVAGLSSDLAEKQAELDAKEELLKSLRRTAENVGRNHQETR